MTPVSAKLGWNTQMHTCTHFGAISFSLNWPSLNPFFLPSKAFLQKEGVKGRIRKANSNKMFQMKICLEPRKSHIYSVGSAYAYGKKLCINFSGIMAATIIIIHLANICSSQELFDYNIGSHMYLTQEENMLTSKHEYLFFLIM